MSQNEKNVPKRRFKEFENAEAWEQRKFDKEVEFYSGLTYSPNDVNDNGTFVLRSSNVKNGEIVDADNVYVNSEIVNSSNVKEGDIIVVVRNGSRSLIGKHAQIKRRMDNTVIGAFMTGIRSNQSSFINALMDTQQFSREVKKNLGATINQITNGMFREMRFMFPDIQEQNEIGNFFNNLDNLITFHQCKLEKMKALKKSYLTDMFPAEGERKPKRRFAGFTEDWKQRKLEEVTSKIGSGKTPLGGEKSYKDDGVYLIRSQNVNYDTINFFDVVYIDDEIDEEMKNSRVFNGDVLLNITGASIGRSAVFHSTQRANVNQHVCIVRPLNKEVSPEFIHLNLTSNNGQNQINSSQAGGAREGLNFQQISKITFMFPKLEEQIKIGDFFSKLDNLITIHQYKLEKLQNIKKAYLNEMFI